MIIGWILLSLLVVADLCVLAYYIIEMEAPSEKP